MDARKHFGSRLAFDAEGHLFITVGERGQGDRAQDLGQDNGKVIRLYPDGSVPEDNPFVGVAGARPEIFSYGHRNPQGLAIHPQSGIPWLNEHGARGGDEVNVVRPGVNYGWPVITYGIDYSGAPIGEGTHKEGMAQPIHYWVPSIAPSGMAFYDGEAFPEWRGDLFVGALKAELLVRLELDGERVVAEERLLEARSGRIRDVEVGPDGYLYLLTDESDGGLYRLEPAARRPSRAEPARVALDGASYPRTENPSLWELKPLRFNESSGSVGFRAALACNPARQRAIAARASFHRHSKANLLKLAELSGSFGFLGERSALGSLDV